MTAQKLLSIIIPVYNEQFTVEKIIEKIRLVDLTSLGVRKEIIVVDDGSTDTTPDVLRRIDRHDSNTDITRIFFNRLNLGKGTTLRVGLKYARGEIILIQDADLEYDPQDYYKLIEPILSGKAKVVLGSRFRTKLYHRRYFFSHFLGTMFLTLVANILYGARITDESTCYKVATADVFKSLNLKCREFEFCPEFIAKVRKKKIPIYEVPINYYPRTRAEGKKIAWKDGWQAFTTLLYYRFFD
jgi:glycosyltransferase involved in cell wall biosynthesis